MSNGSSAAGACMEVVPRTAAIAAQAARKGFIRAAYLDLPVRCTPSGIRLASSPVHVSRCKSVWMQGSFVQQAPPPSAIARQMLSDLLGQPEAGGTEEQWS